MSLQPLQQTSRLDFLFEAGYEMLSQAPSLSRYYMNEFQNSLTEFELSIPKQTDRLSCKRCGQILMAGLTQKIRLIKKTKIMSICLTCQDIKKYHGTIKNKKNIPKSSTKSLPIVEISKPTPIVKKKNKGKNNNLKALLSKQQQNNQKSTGNNLSDFLSLL